METDEGIAADKPPLYVVRITGVASNGAEVRGTGFVINAEGHVATCRHVVYPTPDGVPIKHLLVKLPYPAEQPCSYQIKGTSDDDDLAILESTVALDFPVPEAPLRDDGARGVKAGQSVSVWGYSAAEHYTQAQRFECAISGLAASYGRIGLSGNVNPGDSGGPVLDAQRRVVGITQAKDQARDGQAMAIPVSLLQAFMHKLGVGHGYSPDAGSNAVFQAPSPPDYSLVGRDPLLSALKLRLSAGRDLALCFKPGVGKSALATALANDHEVRSQFDGGVLWASLNLSPNVLSELRKWGAALGLTLDRMEELDNQAAGSTAHQAVQLWAAALSQKIGQRRMLLVIDDAWDLEPAKALLLSAPNVSHVVTTREPVKVAGMLGNAFDVTVVDELTEEDGIEFLHQLAPNAVDLFPEEARNLFQLVGGLPQGLLLLGVHLRQVSRDSRRRRIADAYRDIQNTLEEHMKPLHGAIKISYDALPDDETRAALCALSVFRAKPGKFSEDAALEVLRKPASVIDRLNDSGLIETANSGDDPNDLPYTMHRTIAEFARAQLSDVEAYILHRRAAAYFSQWLREYDEGDPGSYGYQYRYENARWQDAMDDFLYHLARTGDPSSAIVEFGSIYFNAFWWWGCYADFPFCKRLLQQAETRRLADEARYALDLLTKFDAAYPKETQRQGGGDWAAVREALTTLRQVGGLDGELAAGANEVIRHTRALTDIFLAEAYRFGGGAPQDREEAERLYLDALSLLPREDWSHPWVLYHLGDLYLEDGRFDQAQARCEACLAIAQSADIPLKERDYEVIANAYRLRMEIAGHFARQGEVLDGHQRAVLHAYAFQAIPEPADAYTVAFYRQITQRSAASIQALHKCDPAAAVELCAKLRDYWSSRRQLALTGDDASASPEQLQAMLASDGTDALCACLYPPPPTPQEMYVRGSRYFNEAIAVLNEKMGSA